LGEEPWLDRYIRSAPQPTSQAEILCWRDDQNALHNLAIIFAEVTKVSSQEMGGPGVNGYREDRAILVREFDVGWYGWVPRYDSQHLYRSEKLLQLSALLSGN
jgi:hypothetical protein